MTLTLDDEEEVKSEHDQMLGVKVKCIHLEHDQVLSKYDNVETYQRLDFDYKINKFDILTFEHVKVLSENDNVEPDLSPDVDIKIGKVDNVMFEHDLVLCELNNVEPDHRRVDVTEDEQVKMLKVNVVASAKVIVNMCNPEHAHTMKREQDDRQVL